MFNPRIPLLLLLVGVLGLTGDLTAQQSAAPEAPRLVQRPDGSLGAPGEPSEATAALQVHAFTLQYQRASEALAAVVPLLSPRGTVELQPGSNTLLVRDTAAALARVSPLVAAFDHPARPLTLEVHLVEAGAAGESNVSPALGPTGGRPLPKDLLGRLRKLLPYASYQLVAGAEFGTSEGQAVTYDLGQRYRIAFELGTLLDGRRLRVANFRIERLPEQGEPALVHTNLNVTLGQTTVLGLSRGEASPRALMVVLVARLGSPAGADAP
jgi:hypothetical protein